MYVADCTYCHTYIINILNFMKYNCKFRVSMLELVELILELKAIRVSHKA